MNREIKFRAWDFKNNRMFYPRHMAQVPATGMWVSSENIMLGEHKGCRIEKVEAKPCNELNDIEENRQTYALMQYTGLKDKNGKEIYEGDIVRWARFSEMLQNNLVIFNDGVFQKDGEYYDCEGHLSERDEVIGNIYENPELVEKEE